MPKLNAAMTQIGDLLDDNSLFKDITADVYRATFTSFLETADVRMPAEKMRITIPMIEIINW